MKIRLQMLKKLAKREKPARILRTKFYRATFAKKTHLKRQTCSAHGPKIIPQSAMEILALAGNLILKRLATVATQLLQRRKGLV